LKRFYQGNENKYPRSRDSFAEHYDFQRWHL